MIQDGRWNSNPYVHTTCWKLRKIEDKGGFSSAVSLSFKKNSTDFLPISSAYISLARTYIATRETGKHNPTSNWGSISEEDREYRY